MSNTIVFAGGGTGGHLFPSLAVAERLAELEPACRTHFICSNRPIDASILRHAGADFTPSPVQPLPPPTRPWRAIAFLRSYRDAKRRAADTLTKHNTRAVVAMGGFVSGPVVAAANALQIPTLLVNLDAKPGKANRWLARWCDRVLSVYPTPRLPQAQRIAFPLRKSCIADRPAEECRRALGLDPDRCALLVTGASQGAQSINDLMLQFLLRPSLAEALRGWSVLHLSGSGRTSDMEYAYQRSGVAARVVDFCHNMGLAWGAACLAISRAGAGSVAEAQANAVPTLFLPYPHHRDQHQRLNVQPLLDARGAMVFEERLDPARNADRLADPLTKLLLDSAQRHSMREALRRSHPGNGADTVARAALQLATPGPPVLQSRP